MNANPTGGARLIRCPGCDGPSVYAPANAYRPFCSARCKNNDFGAWASESYSVPADTEGQALGADVDAPDALAERPDLPH